MDIVLLEDNIDWSEACTEFLAAKFPGVTVEHLETESEFRKRLASFVESPPRAFVIDIWFPWAVPSPNIPEPPPEVNANGFFMAGIRCWDTLNKIDSLKHIPIVFWTIMTLEDLKGEMEREELPKGAYYVSKEGGWEDLEKVLLKVISNSRDK